MRQSVGSTPCLLGKAVDCTYIRGSNYLEVSVKLDYVVMITLTSQIVDSLKTLNGQLFRLMLTLGHPPWQMGSSDLSAESSQRWLLTWLSSYR